MITQIPLYRTSGVVPVGGTLAIGYQPRGSRPERVTQVSNEMVGAGSAQCTLRLNDTLICPLAASRDAATGEPFIWLNPGDLLTVVWTGAPVGANGTIGVIRDYGPEA